MRISDWISDVCSSDLHSADFTQGLADYSLLGVRIGVLREQVGNHAGVSALFDKALADLEAAGAVLVDVKYDWPEGFWPKSLTVLLYELQRDMSAYLDTLPDPSQPDPDRQSTRLNSRH